MVCEQKFSDLLAAVDTLATMQLQYVLFSWQFMYFEN